MTYRRCRGHSPLDLRPTAFAPPAARSGTQSKKHACYVGHHKVEAVEGLKGQTKDKLAKGFRGLLYLDIRIFK